ncbi:MAG TPA: citramalate synthase [Actinomycetota bacterium]
MPSPLILYDTTLRDGAQREGISLTVEDKLKIASWIDRLGVAYIEGGWPGSNPKDMEFFQRAAEIGMRSAKLSCFGATRRAGGRADADQNLRDMVATEAPVACIVGKASRAQVELALGATTDENRAMIADTVAFLKGEGMEVFFDAEHFFDGYKQDAAVALDALKAAIGAGATTVVLCDTNGGAMPGEVRDVVAAVIELVGGSTIVGVHFHNDTDCAVANSIASIELGATHVQGTVNGIGERCGNANLLSIIANCALKLNLRPVSGEQLLQLTAASHAVAEICNVSPDPHQPYVGASAFATKAGLHTSGLSKMAGAYEHVDPGLVGNARRLLVSELAGRSTIVMKGRELGIDLETDPATAVAVLNAVKDLEHVGYTFEAADASLELLIRRTTGDEREFFRLESFRVLMEKRATGDVGTEATVKIWCRGERHIATAEGNGPVNALDGALRLALTKFYPALAQIELTDYKVRILDSHQHTAATTRVLLESTDGRKEWSTIGVSPNIIEASWQALCDSIAYGLVHDETGNETGDEMGERE